MLAQSLACVSQPASAVSVGQRVLMPSARRWLKAALTQSTCCSIDTLLLASTDGLPGSVKVKKLGKPTVISPRSLIGPWAHCCFSVRPSRPVMSTATMAPVIASKPVA